MWLPYNTNQELTHISMIFTYWIPWVYQQYTWIAITVTLIVLLPLCLWIYQVYCSEKWWRFVEATVVYPRPNLYIAWFLEFKRTVWFYQEIGYLIILIVVSHYFPYFFISKILLFIGVIFIPIECFRMGYRNSLLISIYIVLINIGYYYNFNIGLPIIPPHYYVNWLSFLNHGNPVNINPYDFIVDTNKYMYVYALLILYTAMIRHILNYVYWKYSKIRYIPYENYRVEMADNCERNMRIHKIKKLRKQLIQQRNKAIKSGTYVPRTNSKLVKPDSFVVGEITDKNTIDVLTSLQSSNITSISTNTGLLRSLKLLGFKQQAVQVMLAEYNADTLEKALDKLDTLNDLTHPKTNFLEILQEIHDGDSHA